MENVFPYDLGDYKVEPKNIINTIKNNYKKIPKFPLRNELFESIIYSLETKDINTLLLVIDIYEKYNKINDALKDLDFKKVKVNKLIYDVIKKMVENYSVNIKLEKVIIPVGGIKYIQGYLFNENIYRISEKELMFYYQKCKKELKDSLNKIHKIKLTGKNLSYQELFIWFKETLQQFQNLLIKNEILKFKPQKIKVLPDSRPSTFSVQRKGNDIYFYIGDIMKNVKDIKIMDNISTVVHEYCHFIQCHDLSVPFTTPLVSEGFGLLFEEFIYKTNLVPNMEYSYLSNLILRLLRYKNCIEYQLNRITPKQIKENFMIITDPVTAENETYRVLLNPYITTYYLGKELFKKKLKNNKVKFIELFNGGFGSQTEYLY